jgi:ABC-type lipoprotein export system ATPase subunit
MLTHVPDLGCLLYPTSAAIGLGRKRLKSEQRDQLEKCHLNEKGFLFEQINVCFHSTVTVQEHPREEPYLQNHRKQNNYSN